MTIDRTKFVFVAESLFYRTELGIRRVDATEVVAIKSAGKYQHLITTKNTITVVASAAAMEYSVADLPFIRIHRSWMINLGYLSFISRHRNYVNVGELELPLGKIYTKKLMSALGFE